MEFIKIILLFLGQFVIGFGLLGFLKLDVKSWMKVGVSVLLGVGVLSLLLLVLVFCKISLTAGSFNATFLSVALLANISSIKQKFGNYKELFSGEGGLFRAIKYYELPMIIVIGFVFFVGAWRCYYLPPTPRDLTSGPEVIAEYAVREQRIDNSVFTVNLESTNNQFKSPYIIMLQMLYKFAGFPFGQVWLCGIVLGFLIFLYQALARNIHPVLAGALVLWFLCIPEMYAYTVMVLYDYSNAVFFTVGVYFVYDYLANKRTGGHLILASVMLLLATYVRSETLVLLPFVLVVYCIAALVWAKDSVLNVAKQFAVLFVPSLVIYFVTGSFYLNHYIPQHYDVGGLVNKKLGDLNPFYTRLSDTIDLVMGNGQMPYYGNFVNVFFVIFLVDIVLRIFWKKGVEQIAKEDKVWLLWASGAVLLIVGIAFLGYLLPLMDLNNTTKRALFKVFPFMLLYCGHSLVLKKITYKLS
ncbi:MAG: hypothetical protein QM642_03635 [Edaphocola sp.]